MVKNTQVPLVRLAILIFLLFSGALSLHAQEFYLGLKTGYGLSNIDYKGTANSKISAKQSMNLALTYNYRFTEQFGLNIETGFSDRGVKIENEALDYRFNYLDMPLLLDFYPLKNIRLNAGPEISYLVSAMNKASDGTKTNISDTFDNRWALNGAIGVNYSVSFFMDMGLRYQLPITTISKTDPTLNINNVKSRYFQLYLLFKIAN